MGSLTPILSRCRGIERSPELTRKAILKTVGESGENFVPLEKIRAGVQKKLPGTTMKVIGRNVQLLVKQNKLRRREYPEGTRFRFPGRHALALVADKLSRGANQLQALTDALRNIEPQYREAAILQAKNNLAKEQEE